MPASRWQAFAICAALAVPPAAGQDPAPPERWEAGVAVALIDPALTHWVGERVNSDGHGPEPDALPSVTDRTLRITPRFGWTRTRDVHYSFRLEFEFRGRAGDAFAVYVRTWPPLDEAGAPTNAHSFTFRAVDGEWHPVVVECRGSRADVFVEGRRIADLNLGNPAGHLGLRGAKGEIEIRNMTLTPLRQPLRKLNGLRPDDNETVTMPRLLREVKPRYTPDAMRQRIQGAVLMEIVVTEDGNVGEVAILQSLDPVFGLDEEAVTAAKAWRFEPARRDGKAVPLIVTLELQFTLK